MLGAPGAWPKPVADCAGFSVVGGGDTTAAVRRYGLDSWIDHLSTGGGATLELIEKGDLPGLAALAGEQLALGEDGVSDPVALRFGPFGPNSPLRTGER